MTGTGDADAGTTARRFALGRFEPAPPLLAGRYELGERIGDGATASVLRAKDQETGATVAVKLFHAGTAELSRSRREQETAALRAVRHPGLVAYLDAGVDEGHAYLVMDYVPGPNLAERLRSGPFPAGPALELGIRLADALAHVHAHEVTHRDLKPANILLAGDEPRIADFGVAFLVDATRVTQTGAVVGTAAYLSPEQVLGERPGPASDVYALGLVLLECLTGVREYPGTAAETSVVRLHRSPRIPPGTPEPLARTLRAMTLRDPDERPSASAVARALRGEKAVRLPLPVRLARLGRRSDAAPSRRRTTLVAGLPVMLVAVGALVLATPVRPATGSVPETPADSSPPPASPSMPDPATVAPPVPAARTEQPPQAPAVPGSETTQTASIPGSTASGPPPSASSPPSAPRTTPSQAKPSGGPHGPPPSGPPSRKPPH
ncbi:serine/threonine-protein kinase [Amycolatopsis benzoatilytica]|uniref:serine/threonine-protein kinase n=1 Tax=Amycolatopsis benzoatilytica TaxID=346045 RepID=UPI00037E0591|nr:serine/threonine-protein kinase [Amycolatopsis benzoatilytica]